MIQFIEATKITYKGNTFLCGEMPHYITVFKILFLEKCLTSKM